MRRVRRMVRVSRFFLRCCGLNLKRLRIIFVAIHETIIAPTDLVVGREVVNLGPHLDEIVVLQLMERFIRPIRPSEQGVCIDPCDILPIWMILGETRDGDVDKIFLEPKLGLGPQLNVLRIAELRNGMIAIAECRLNRVEDRSRFCTDFLEILE